MSDESKFHIIEWEMMDRKKFIALSAVNSFFLRSVIYPLVLVKTRLQVQKHNSVYSGSLDAFAKIIRYEGYCGLYRGFWVNSMQIASGITYILAYEKTRDILSNYTNISDSYAKAFLSGGIGSAVSTTINTPIDVVSQHIMIALDSKRTGKQSQVTFRSPYFRPLKLDPGEVKRSGYACTITRQLKREGGYHSFYKGYLSALILYVPSAASWWMLYQYFNEFLYSFPTLVQMPYIVLNSMSGTLSGASVSILTNPLDLLRANIQVHRPSSYKSAMKYIWKEDGWRIFNKGLSARLIQSCLSSTLIVIGYETMKRFSVDKEYADKVRW